MNELYNKVKLSEDDEKELKDMREQMEKRYKSWDDVPPVCEDDEYKISK